MKLRTGKAPFRAGSSLLYIDISQLFKLQLQLNHRLFMDGPSFALFAISYWGSGSAGGASLGRADAAQVCNNVGFLAVDGEFECSVAPAARQIVSERWWEC